MKKIFFLLLFLSFNVFSAPVDVNSADAKTISKSLRGIGPKKAEAIVAYRNEKGPFKSYKDLAKVKGIGAKTVASNKSNILLNSKKGS